MSHARPLLIGLGLLLLLAAGAAWAQPPAFPPPEQRVLNIPWTDHPLSPSLRFSFLGHRE